MIYIDHHYCKKNMNILIKKNILLQIYYSPIYNLCFNFKNFNM